MSDILSIFVMPDEGIARRKLYSDNKEVYSDRTCPVILNGISEFVKRPDLLDRSVRLELPRISAKNRRDEKEFWQEFQKQKPRLLGSLLELLSSVLRILPTVKLSQSPRMADFAKVVAAVSKIKFGSAERLLKAYDRNRAELNESAIEASELAIAIRRLMEQRKGEMWNGRATDLLTKSQNTMNSPIRNENGNIMQPNQVKTHLRRVIPNLRNLGIEIEFKKEGHNRDRMIYIKRRKKTVRIVRKRKKKKQTGDDQE